MELKTFRLALSTLNSSNGTDILLPGTTYLPVEMAFLFLIAGSVSLGTIIGNILVMLSIIINRSLQTINNYYLFSLAVADLIIGVSSMNLYTLYVVLGYWPLGPVVCDIWLVLDYMVCTTSAMHILIISIDRYFCITKPLSYPTWRTTKMAGMMIMAAWVISFIILFGMFFEGVRTVPDMECYVPALDNPAITFCTAIAAFYLPVAIMLVLYWQISRASKSHVKTGKGEPSGLKQENPCQGEVGNHLPTPDEDDDKETQSTDWGQDGEAPHAASGVGGREAENLKSHQGDKGPMYSGASGTAEVVQKHAQPPAPVGHKGAPAAHAIVTVTKQLNKRKVASSREKKVTRTIMAILVAFVVTWSPYEVMVLMNAICSNCVPNVWWTIGYWILFINSTVNPACYALCNATFKKTFKHLLLCKYQNIRSGR